MTSDPTLGTRVKSGWRRLVDAGVVAALATAVVTCHYEKQNARVAGVQTYNLSRLATFRDTGGVLDQKAAAFADAAAAGKPLDPYRADFVAALRDHAAKAQALSDVFSASDLAGYQGSLERLSDVVSSTSDARSGGRIKTALGANVVERFRMANEAQKQI